MRVTVRTARLAGALLLGAAGLAACGRANPPAPAVVEEVGGGLLRLATTGPSASAAVEAGLNQATVYCATQNRMIAVEGTQIEPRGYQLRFRCLETGTPGTVTAAVAPPAAPVAVSAVTGAPLVAMPAAAPVLDTAPARTGPALPGATRALPPIAATTPAAPRPAPASAQPPSGFWQIGR
ncbi:hypothetical protein [Roseococcus suduntuyensis]|uniref:Lipoprotein n=1 Tax=Roseococcus suduntuyensis TaxID=455361 RepID=A0A840AGC2_9PROT|nr:hypothetical protein [Roseococcus suduntuyensis]MBB3899596.1 hypothetical protein [Roseococcus suduntuyensis]